MNDRGAWLRWQARELRWRRDFARMMAGAFLALAGFVLTLPWLASWHAAWRVVVFGIPFCAGTSTAFWFAQRKVSRQLKEVEHGREIH